ncbi:MAG: hypothetical protein ACREBB_02465 [Nitrosotalea sp.]
MIRLVLAVPVLFLVACSILPAFADTGVVSVVSGKTFQVSYNANGVNIQDIETNPTYDELTVSVQVSSPNASLELTIPRDLLDSKQGNADIPFITVVDGTLANVKEQTPTSTTRTLSLQLTSGNSQIEIIGTYVAVPSGSSPPIVSSSPPSNSQTGSQVQPSTSGSEKYTPVKNTTSSNALPTQPSISKTPSQTNTIQNTVFNIPYLPNVAINLSPIDWAVIVAIVLVIIIVIASAARKKPSKIVKSR